ncbi:GHKL domain-containing protein [Leuconostoc lactis]|uniref:GHKL domain-containing protein n=1 Tax=Leuconostoc lactis TaxID=1246 RepID=UPI00020D9E91|nr:GHKL domain-containing protein [Leuconostoc lactis]
MLTILSYINLLMQPLTSTIAAAVWFSLLVGQPQIARRTIWQLLGWLFTVKAISRWLVPTAYQVSVTSTLLIVSLVYVGRQTQRAAPLGMRGLNDYLAYLWHDTAYQGSVMWEILSLVGVLMLILLPTLRHQYDLLTCKLQQRDRMLVATQQYTNQLEKQYLVYRTFRHDYKNILASLAYGIQNGNMADVQYAYESVIETSQQALPETQTLALHLIADVNLRSMLLVKYQQALRQSVQFAVDIQQVFQPVALKMDVDFYRVFGILLDNAIEAAIETPEKLVTIVFVGSEQVAIINSCLHRLDTTASKQVGYSSKHGHAGLGLYFVHQFLMQRQDIELITVTEKTRVRQELTFGGAI